jgi:hypothetical protein
METPHVIHRTATSPAGTIKARSPRTITKPRPPVADQLTQDRRASGVSRQGEPGSVAHQPSLDKASRDRWLGPTAPQDQVGKGGNGVSDRVGSGGLQFAATDWRLGEADGSDSGGPADLNVGHVVADQDGLMGGPVQEVERTLNGRGVRLHQLGLTGNSGDDGLDQVPQLVAVEEGVDGCFGVVANHHDGPSDLCAGQQQVERAGGRFGNLRGGDLAGGTGLVDLGGEFVGSVQRGSSYI